MMLTPIEKVLTLKNIDLLANVGPRHLLVLAEVVREVEMWKDQVIYGPSDPADALYVVVEGKVQLTSSGSAPVEIEPGQAFGTWSLIDDSERGQGAVCVADGLLIALSREDFYDVAADDLTLLRELVRILARRLRALAEKMPEEARVENEGLAPAPEREEPAPEGSAVQTAERERAILPGASLEAAVLDKLPAAPPVEPAPEKESETPAPPTDPELS